MSTESQLIALEDISADKAPAIYGHNKLAAYVALAREQAANEVPDLTTRKGRERIASLAAQVSRSKTAVEKPGRDYLRRIKEMPKAIEAELREFVQEMDKLRDEVRAPLNEWEAAEAGRVARIQGQVDRLRDTDLSGMSAADIAGSIENLEAHVIDAQYEEFEPEAHRVKAASLAILREALAARQKHEAEQAELERLRAEAAQREQKEREERIAREAAEQARLEAEQRAQAERDAAAKREADAKAAAEQRELQLKLEAEQSARRELEAQQRAEQAEREAEARAERAAAAERQRQADEQARIEAEAKAREKDKAHKKQINNEALAAFIAGGMPEECAKQAITLIAQRKIPHISISY
ncbi:hypothetical protein [Stutzerimonas nitrititolerans]|uniref:hypothetical protein n=1 Tax=Stutzerimonas nitrititolerans TaxID=2482751 RepID=UPI0028A6EA60|nr:hypothetical protein [Stutzerimonas nitrititolerans]